MLDAGRPVDSPGPSNFSCLIEPGVDIALCFVRYRDPTHLDEAQKANKDFVDVLGKDYEDSDNMLAMTARQANISTVKIEEAATLAVASKNDVPPVITVDTQLWEVLAAVGSTIKKGWEPHGTWVG